SAAARAGFVAAAGAADKPAPEPLALAVRICDQAAATSPDVVLLARLGWVLSRNGETARAQTVLDRAVALKPADPAARRELAGILAAAGRAAEAMALYQGLTLSAEDHH